MADIAFDARISPDDSVLAGASRLFFFLWDSAWKHGDDTIAGDAEALHDMRVNLRRLRTAMSNFEGSKSDPLLSKSLRKEIRGARSDIGVLGDKLGAVRDFDVLEDYVRHYAKKQLKVEIEVAPGLLELLETLQEERKAHFKPMTKALKRARESDELREEFGRWALGLPAAQSNDLSYRAAAKLVLSQRLDEVFRYENSLEPGGSDEAHHELRKSLRRVRYTLETMSVAFERPIKSFVKTLVGMQDTLGEMQDRTVLRETTARIFGDDLPEDVELFDKHGVMKREKLLEETRTAWQKAKTAGFWDELRAL
jgi:CHAD domain-containing protein